MPLAPGRLLGGYEIVGLIGSGGMGEVYQARDTRLPRMVAIKFVSDDLAADPKAADRLAREARLTSALNHPNIVTVYDIGEDAGRPYIVMEFVAGRSLHDRLVSGALPQKQAVEIACQIADGLAAAHEAGVVHRDLKPRNIMITDDGRVKIVDFGLGRTAKAPALPEDETVLAPEMTAPHVVMGTAGYMAPEQALGHAFDFRADQFALGVVIYEMITGQRAFKRESARQTQAAVIEAEPRSMAELCRAVHPELVTLVERCLEKDPSDRYASTKDLARDVHDVQLALTSRSAPVTLSRPVPRWVTPVLLVVGALVAVVTAAVLWRPGVDPLAEGRRHLVRFDRARDLEAAVTLLREAVDKDPGNPVAHAALAEALWRQYDQPLPPDDALAEQARAQISEALRLAGERDAYPFVVQAMMSLGTDSGYAGAEEAARRAVAIEPSSSEAHRELGRALEKLGKVAEAEAALRQAVALAPEDWRPLNYLAGFHLSAKPDQDKAEEALQRALSLTPDNTKVYNNVGSSHFRRGMVQEITTPEGLEREQAEFALAEAAWQQSNALSPNATAYSNLGLLAVQRGAYPDAVRNFEHAVRLSRSSFTPIRNLAAALWFAPGQRERATRVYGDAIAAGERERKLRPKDEGLLAELASAYAVTGRTGEARNIIAELEALPALRPGTKYTLGSTFEILGDREKALALLGKPTKQSERSPWLEQLRKDPRYGR